MTVICDASEGLCCHDWEMLKLVCEVSSVINQKSATYNLQQTTISNAAFSKITNKALYS